MELFMLSPRDLNLYYAMGEIAECINKYYQILIDLEYQGLAGSKEYLKTLESLEESIKKENSLYSTSKVSAKLCKALIAFALQTKVPENFPNNIEAIVTSNDKLLTIRRVLTKLQLRLMDDTDEMIHMMPNGIKEVMSSLGEANIDDVLKNSIPSSVRIHTALETDMLTLFLTYLNESINLKAFESFRRQLIKTKYLTAFIEPAIETSLVSKKFMIEDETWINSKVISDFNRVPDDVYNAFRNIFGIGIANEQLENMLKVGDYNYYDSNKNLEVMLRGSLLRASLFIVSKDTAENIQDNFNEHTSSVEYEAVGYSRKISEAIAKEAFSKLPKDKEKHKVISLKPNFIF